MGGDLRLIDFTRSKPYHSLAWSGKSGFTREEDFLAKILLKTPIAEGLVEILSISKDFFGLSSDINFFSPYFETILVPKE